MARIPASVDIPLLEGLQLKSKGKVKNTYRLPDDSELLLPVYSPRLSVFDIVLKALVRLKGEILNATNIFWRELLADYGFAHDLVAYGSNIDQYLPGPLRGNVELQRRATVIQNLSMIPVEAIFRIFLTGSGWKAYQKTAPNHLVCGNPLPEGLTDGSQLPFIMFTPTTKAEEGHDQHLLADDVSEEYGVGLERMTLQIAEIGAEYLRKKGVLLADSKFEFGRGNGKLVIADEVLTMDSSRFWLTRDYEAARAKGGLPPSYDKQVVRNWAATKGIDKLDPEVPADVDRAHAIEVPEEVLKETTRRYRYIFYLITGTKLEVFQKDQMGIDVEVPRVPVEILIGSLSDEGQIVEGERFLAERGVLYRIHVVSCDRNPDELRSFVDRELKPGSVVVAGAGLAARLPGMVKSWLVHFGRESIPVLGVGFNNPLDLGSEAARLSIEMLPNQPVVLNQDGKAYLGPDGFIEACADSQGREFYTPTTGKPKPPIFNYRVYPGNESERVSA